MFDADLAETRFHDLPTAMTTMILFLCLDPVGSICRIFMHEEPMPIYHPVAVVLTVLLNIVAMAIAEGATVRSVEDKELQLPEVQRPERDIGKDLGRLSLRP